MGAAKDTFPPIWGVKSKSLLLTSIVEENRKNKQGRKPMWVSLKVKSNLSPRSKEARIDGGLRFDCSLD